MREAVEPTQAEALQAGQRKNRMARWLENRFLPGLAESRGRGKLLFERSTAAVNADLAEWVSLPKDPVTGQRGIFFSDWRKQTPTIPQK